MLSVVHDGLLDVARFCVCVCKLGASLAGAMVGASASALGDKRVFCGSCLICVSSIHNIKSIRVFEDDVM
jgi:hypothetical protein